MNNRELETRYNQMKATWKNLVNANIDLLDENKYLKEEIERLNNIINKGIELTNKIIEAGWDYDEKDTFAIKLEEILKGSDKE